MANFKYFLCPLYNLQEEMKLALKTLKGEVFNVEAEPETTILEVKTKIQQQKGIEKQSQKIVYRGKPALDTDTVGSLGIKEGDFLVIMSILKKPETKPKEETKPEQKEESKPAPKPVQKTELKPESKPEPKPSNEAQINELMSMGFEREKCIAALNAAFNNTEVAVDYLINGIPAGNVNPGQGSGNAEEVLRALMSTPEFEPIKQMLQSDPTSINVVMEQIMATSPPLYNMIAQNPEAFQRVLMEDLEGVDGDGDGDEDFDEDQDEAGDQGESIPITQEDDAAIKRLMGLGFTKIDCAQAYFACDKNEEMAANLLFDRQANGDMDQGLGQQGGNQDDGDDDNLFN